MAKKVQAGEKRSKKAERMVDMALVELNRPESLDIFKKFCRIGRETLPQPIPLKAE